MNKDYVYSDEDYQSLHESLNDALRICRPDEYQYYQNELTMNMAKFLLKPYLENLKSQEK